MLYPAELRAPVAPGYKVTAALSSALAVVAPYRVPTALATGHNALPVRPAANPHRGVPTASPARRKGAWRQIELIPPIGWLFENEAAAAPVLRSAARQSVYPYILHANTSPGNNRRSCSNALCVFTKAWLFPLPCSSR